jgi:N5-(cytidine 5'-diphosphoramidyl)-L-glutamine hydrolase
MRLKKKNFIFVSCREDYLVKRKERRFSIDKRLLKWIKAINLNPILITDINQIFFFKNLEPLGVILSGGNNINKLSDRFKIEKKLILWAKKNKKPILGICHGLQMLAYLDKAKLKKINKHVRVKHSIIDMTKNNIYPKFVNSFHTYGLFKVPSNFLATACALDKSIEAIRHKKYNWEGWMWHPERDKKFNLKLIRRAKKIFKDKI